MCMPAMRRNNDDVRLFYDVRMSLMAVSRPLVLTFRQNMTRRPPHVPTLSVHCLYTFSLHEEKKSTDGAIYLSI